MPRHTIPTCVSLDSGPMAPSASAAARRGIRILLVGSHPHGNPIGFLSVRSDHAHPHRFLVQRERANSPILCSFGAAFGAYLVRLGAVQILCKGIARLRTVGFGERGGQPGQSTRPTAGIATRYIRSWCTPVSLNKHRAVNSGSC